MVRLDEPRVLWDLCGLRVVVRHVLVLGVRDKAKCVDKVKVVKRQESWL